MDVRKTLWSGLLLTAIGIAGGTAIPAWAQDTGGYVRAGYDTDGQSVDSIAVFFEPLSHYGRWLDGRYGRVWAPNVGRDWRPYTIGHWERGAYGLTWRSDEPFGWAVFHFGRWAFDPAIGWVWLPDTTWGPGWVAWRDGDDVAGWAPLPPQVVLSYGVEYGFNDWGYDQWYQPGWVYVPRAYLYARSLRGAYLPVARNRDFWDHTRGVTHYDRVDGQIVNHSIAEPRRGSGNDERRRADLNSDQSYGGGGRTAPAISGSGGGFVPLPGGYGDGFVPGRPLRPRTGVPLPVPRTVPAPTPAPLFHPAPMPLFRPAMPAPAAPRPAPAPPHRESGNTRPR